MHLFHTHHWLLLLLTVVLNRVDGGRGLDVLRLVLVDHVLLLHLSVALSVHCGGGSVVVVAVDQIRAVRSCHRDVHRGRCSIEVRRRGGVVWVRRLLGHGCGLWTDRCGGRLSPGRGGRCSKLERLPSAETLQITNKVSC